MSFMSTHCRQVAYVVFALRRDCINELFLIQEVFARRFVLLGVLHECRASKLRKLGLLGGPQQHLANLLRDARHDGGLLGSPG
jgi:hypothetical protein